MDERNHRLIARTALMEREIAEIKGLAEACNRYEHLHMRMHDSMLRAQSREDVIAVLDYEDDVLAGYLGMTRFGHEIREVTAMVHPRYRRRGIFRHMLAVAVDDGKRSGVRQLLLICERDSTSGQACLKTLPVGRDHTEYNMVLAMFQPRTIFDERLRLRLASEDDLDGLLALTEPDEREMMRHVFASELQRPGEYLYLVTLGGQDLGCDEPVGAFCLQEQGREIHLYTFLVRPQYQGQGFGRQILEEAIRLIQERSEKEIVLEVDAENVKALNLYRSAGFEIRATYEYYSLDIKASLASGKL